MPFSLLFCRVIGYGGTFLVYMTYMTGNEETIYLSSAFACKNLLVTVAAFQQPHITGAHCPRVRFHA